MDADDIDRLVADFDPEFAEEMQQFEQGQADLPVPSIPVPFSVAFVAHSLIGQKFNAYDAELMRAWVTLCANAEWHAWYTSHQDQLRSPGAFHYLQVDDRERRMFRRRRDGLSLFVPVTEYDEAVDKARYLRGLHVDFQARLARMEGVEPPPALSA